MKNYTEAERHEHIKKWKKSSLVKAEYAKSAGILPGTFYKWAQGKGGANKGFVEVRRKRLPESHQGMAIEKDGITVRIPFPAEVGELEKVFAALRGAR